MEVQDGASTKTSFDILDSFANALLTDSQFDQSYSANSADTAQSISYDLSHSNLVCFFNPTTQQIHLFQVLQQREPLPYD